MNLKPILTAFACLLLLTPALSQTFDELNREVIQLAAAGRYEEAISISLKSIDVAVGEKGEISFEHITALKNTSFLYSNISKHELAVKYYEKCLPVSANFYSPDHYLHLDVMYKLILAYTQAGDKEKSNALAVIYNPKYYSIQKGLQLNNDAGAAMDNGNYAEAEKLLLQALTIVVKHFGENHNNPINVMLQLAHTYKAIARYENAERYFKRAIAGYEAMEETEERPYYTATIQHLGELYRETGRYDEAEKLYLKALAIDKEEEGENNPDYASNLHTLAFFYKTQGRYGEAEPLLLQALSILKEDPGKEDILYATSLMYLADLYVGMAQFGKAEQPATEALSIGRNLSSSQEDKKIILLNNVASLYATMGNYNAAMALYDEGLRLSIGNNDEYFDEYILTLNNAGKLLETLEEYDRADTLYTEALRIMENTIGTTHPDYAATLINSGGILMKKGDLTRAEKILLQAKQVLNTLSGQYNQGYPNVLTSLGLLYKQQGKTKMAEEHYKQVIDLLSKSRGANHPDYANALVNLALLYWSDNAYEKAGQLYTKASEILLAHIENNIIFLSEQEKMKLWNTQSDIFDVLLSMLQQSPAPSASLLNKVYGQQLRLKGLILADASKALDQAKKSTDSSFRELFNTWKTLRVTLSKEIALPENERHFSIDSLEAVINNTEKLINQRSAVLRNVKAKTVTNADIQEQISDDEATIEFVHYCYYNVDKWSDSVVYSAFITTKKDSVPVYLTICNEEQLKRLLEYSSTESSEAYATNLYRSLTIKHAKGSSAKGDSLYKLLWKPIESHLKGITKINIAPSGLLNRVAFSALSSAKNQYLADQYSIRQFSSIRQIADSDRTTTTVKDILLYGGINYNTTPEGEQDNIPVTYKYLPGTLSEAEKISSLFKKYEAELRSASAATEAYLKSKSGVSPSIIHLATHGYVLPDPKLKKNDPSTNNNRYGEVDDPLLRSGIILAGGNSGWNGSSTLTKEDGILTAYEIAQLDLSNTDLAVLSACETALGDIRGNEGVYGLQRGFKMAGVKQMILSLWQVPDKETAELMQLFYIGILKGEALHKAFNEAQKQMRKKYAPYFWAAFVLIE